MKKASFIVFIFIILFSFSVQSQTKNQYSSWFTLIHNQGISAKTSINLDIQLRSENQLKGLKTTLIRPSFNYIIAPNLSTAAGYSFINTKSSVSNSQNPFLTEHAIWEQLLLSHKIKNINFTGRFRLEQRFIEQQAAHIFSQRLRLFSRIQIPLNKPQNKPFTKGTYILAQEEILLNVQNKAQLNSHLFDQNRAFCGIGYRFSPKLDLEAGYANQSIKGKTVNTSNHIFQVTAFTRLKKK